MVTSALVTLRLTCLSGFLANDANCRPRVTQTARFRVTSPSRVASRSGSDGPGPVWFGIASPPSGAISHRLAQRSNPIRRGFASFGTTHESHLARFHSADPAGVAMRHAAGAREGGKGVRGGRAGMSARSCGRVCFACDLDREKVSCVCEGGGGGTLRVERVSSWHLCDGETLAMRYVLELPCETGTASRAVATVNVRTQEAIEGLQFVARQARQAQPPP